MDKLLFSDYGQIHSFYFDPTIDKLYQPLCENDIEVISKVVSQSSKLTISGGAHTFNGSSLPSSGIFHID